MRYHPFRPLSDMAVPYTARQAPAVGVPPACYMTRSGSIPLAPVDASGSETSPGKYKIVNRNIWTYNAPLAW